jgi:signal transduction histidine kinase
LVHSRYSLLAALVLTTVVVTVALSWAGWRLLEQQRDQRTRQQLDATADSLAASIRSKLAETGETLSASLASPERPQRIEGAAVMTARPNGSAIAAIGSVFVPSVPSSSTTDAPFAAGQILEFARQDLSASAASYRQLANHPDKSIRAGALLRLGRVNLNAQIDNKTAALEAYRALTDLGHVRVEDLPAAFIGLYQQRVIAQATGDGNAASLTTRLAEGLKSGEWMLTRGQVEKYLDDLSIAKPDTWPLAEAIKRLWSTPASRSSRGLRVIADGSRPVLVMWRGSAAATTIMAAFLDDFLPPSPSGTLWQLTDAEEHVIAGQRSIARTPSRVVGDTESPWNLRVAVAAPAVDTSEAILLAMMAAMLVFVWGAMYFMARAIRREAAVARLQSDFVAAVSHEFRSPLTTIRQITEMLEIGRVPNEARRHAYYSVLSSETARLQRLVETLLNFGRMEAGAARYRFEEMDVAVLVRRVVAETESSARESGTRIDVDGPVSDVWVRGDHNALALAVRNLLENAIKYSPGQPSVRLELRQQDGHVSVDVIDSGIGIPRSEQQAIFDKFVRGRAAIDANVSGTGVGLAMVRQIIRAHGGDVEVQSEVGQGSRFRLVMPIINSQLPISNSQKGTAVEAVVRS